MLLSEAIKLLQEIDKSMPELDFTDLPGIVAQFTVEGNGEDIENANARCTELWADMQLVGVHAGAEDRGSWQSDRVHYEQLNAVQYRLISVGPNVYTNRVNLLDAIDSLLSVHELIAVVNEAKPE